MNDPYFIPPQTSPFLPCETAADVLTQVWIVVPAILIYQSSVKAVSAIAACSELNSSKKVS